VDNIEQIVMQVFSFAMFKSHSGYMLMIERALNTTCTQFLKAKNEG